VLCCILQDLPGQEKWSDSPSKPSHLESTKRRRTQTPPTSALNLQEAFLQRKLDFIEKSQERVKQLKASAAKRQHAVEAGGVGRSQGRAGQSQGRNMKRRLARGHSAPHTTLTLPGDVSGRNPGVMGGAGVRHMSRTSSVIGPGKGAVSSDKSSVRSKSPGSVLRRIVADHKAAQSATTSAVPPPPVRHGE
jgi:hypothetical protein